MSTTTLQVERCWFKSEVCHKHHQGVQEATPVATALPGLQGGCPGGHNIPHCCCRSVAVAVVAAAMVAVVAAGMVAVVADVVDVAVVAAVVAAAAVVAVVAVVMVVVTQNFG